MRFQSFTISNYKGIQSCTINVASSNPSVFSLVGLNESGKTTILEAINYFVAADVDLQKIYNIEHASVNKYYFVPKSLKANFNGAISISATLSVDKSDLDAINEALSKSGFKLDYESAPKNVTITQNFNFKNSDFVNSTRSWPANFKASRGKSVTKKFINNSHPCWSILWSTLSARLPQICYFPTFLFDLPEKIYIEEKADETPVNRYYRLLFQDILDSIGEDLTINDHIIDRIRKSDSDWSWFSFWQTDRREQVSHVLLKAATKVTAVIMESWKNVFNKSFESRRIEFEYGHDEDHDAIFIKIWLIDTKNAEKYEVRDRSLGFRWFFCFWMFAYFRAIRKNTSGVVFLFDEPASNLHARAQEELLLSMEHLAGEDNVVIYSTHSHYLINPEWLDKSYIVKNSALNYDGVEDEFMASGKTDISALPYKTFVGSHPNQRTYFLPILDALDYKPSELTLERPSLLVEGKADYAFFKLAFAGKNEFGVVPGSGAQSLGPLISLLTGWGFRSAILLDDDKEGRDACKKYEKDWGLSNNNIKRLRDFSDEFDGKSLESILLIELDLCLKDHFKSQNVNKAHLQIFLYEKLAAGDASFLTHNLKKLSKDVIEWASAELA